MVYRHRAGGSSHVIETGSPLPSVVANQEPTTTSFPSGKLTHKHMSPIGESKGALREEMRSAAGRAGVDVAPHGSGRSDAFDYNGRDRGTSLRPAIARGTPTQGAGARDGFNRKAGVHESYGKSEGRDRGTRQTNHDGRVVYRGKSG